jgi:hypothetical protein
LVAVGRFARNGRPRRRGETITTCEISHHVSDRTGFSSVYTHPKRTGPDLGPDRISAPPRVRFLRALVFLWRTPAPPSERTTFARTAIGREARRYFHSATKPSFVRDQFPGIREIDPATCPTLHPAYRNALRGKESKGRDPGLCFRKTKRDGHPAFRTLAKDGRCRLFVHGGGNPRNEGRNRVSRLECPPSPLSDVPADQSNRET